MGTDFNLQCFQALRQVSVRGLFSCFLAMLLVQCHLKRPKGPAQIPYPDGYKGDRTTDRSDDAFPLTTTPIFLSAGEYFLAQDYCKKLPYRQSVVRTGAVRTTHQDPLTSLGLDELTQLESALGFSCSRTAPGGGDRPISERVICIRDLGFVGDLMEAKSIIAGNPPTPQSLLA